MQRASQKPSVFYCTPNEHGIRRGVSNRQTFNEKKHTLGRCRRSPTHGLMKKEKKKKNKKTKLK